MIVPDWKKAGVNPLEVRGAMDWAVSLGRMDPPWHWNILKLRVSWVLSWSILPAWVASWTALAWLQTVVWTWELHKMQKESKRIKKMQIKTRATRTELFPSQFFIFLHPTYFFAKKQKLHFHLGQCSTGLAMRCCKFLPKCSHIWQCLASRNQEMFRIKTCWVCLHGRSNQLANHFQLFRRWNQTKAW